jgi:hypothetical protein
MIKALRLIKQLQDYVEMYGNQPVSVYNRDSNEI